MTANAEARSQPPNRPRSQSLKQYLTNPGPLTLNDATASPPVKHTYCVSAVPIMVGGSSPS